MGNSSSIIEGMSKDIGLCKTPHLIFYRNVNFLSEKASNN